MYSHRTNIHRRVARLEAYRPEALGLHTVGFRVVGDAGEVLSETPGRVVLTISEDDLAL